MKGKYMKLAITVTLFALIVLALLPTAKAEDKAPKSKASSKVVLKKKVEFRKTQEVSFDGSDIDGQVRSPDGSYLLQKRGVQFLPLYKVNNKFEKNIMESVDYLR